MNVMEHNDKERMFSLKTTTVCDCCNPLKVKSKKERWCRKVIFVTVIAIKFQVNDDFLNGRMIESMFNVT